MSTGRLASASPILGRGSATLRRQVSLVSDKACPKKSSHRPVRSSKFPPPVYNETQCPCVSSSWRTGFHRARFRPEPVRAHPGGTADMIRTVYALSILTVSAFAIASARPSKSPARPVRPARPRPSTAITSPIRRLRSVARSTSMRITPSRGGRQTSSRPRVRPTSC